ncbi:excitatory amino acid transporter 3-like isoform X1 [Argiope bruennichi]|uniref:excitatory amino acid transporter 3-like isoform X1 n=1 Tax=Argiope bruennichi TaxID=94029 RepID=UPI002493E822|nr:excitatory amino acid transporter 3-like isoform X1 [Argiope bruennichi]
MSLFGSSRKSEKRRSKISDASWVYMESPDVPLTDPSKTNGTSSTSVQIPANGHSKPRTPDDDVFPVSNKMMDEPSKKHPVYRCLGGNLITVLTFLGVVLGIALGLGLKSVRPWSKREVMYVNFPGELFLNMLKCLILPLIVSSLIAAIGSLDTRLTGKIGIRAVAYYMITTVIAIILGIILVITIRPGVGGSVDESMSEKRETKPTLPEDTLMDLVRNMFPPNIMEACLKQYTTILKMPKGYNKSDNATDLREWDISGRMEGSTNILGLVVFSVVLGITLGEMKAKGKPLLNVFISLSDAVMKITKLVIWLSPVGVLFLVASKILEMKDLAVIAGQIGLYSLTVLAGILIHGFIILPLLYFAFVRKNPYSFLLNMGQALATAFGTASSSATLPVTITCLEEKNHIDPRVSRFCLPIGATINMDGTALYEAVAAIFIAQVRGISLSIGSIIAISITATAASIGAAGIPQAGLVTMVMVLNVVGLPAEDVTLILVVDWILDRFRTTINVLGDAYGSAIVAHFSKNDLQDLPAAEEQPTEMTTL